MVALSVLLLAAQLPVEEPDPVPYLVACPVMLCTLGGAATGLVGYAYAHANFASSQDEPYDFIRHMATVTVMATAASFGASVVAYPFGKLMDLPARVTYPSVLAGSFVGGFFGTLLIPPSMLTRGEGKFLALLSSSFFASVGASVTYAWPYLREAFQPDTTAPALAIHLVIPMP